MIRILQVLVICVSILSAQDSLAVQSPVSVPDSSEQVIVSPDSLQPIADELISDPSTVLPDDSGSEIIAETDSLSEISEAEDSDPLDEMNAVSSEILLDDSLSTDIESIEVEEEIVVAPPVPAFIMEDMPDSIPNEYLALDFGYKGYQWGTPSKTVWPNLPYMEKARFNGDTTAILISGLLEGLKAELLYAFSDSGFWKVEIDYNLQDLSIDDQIELFSTVEKNLASIYGSPKTTSQSLRGPHSNKSGFPLVKYNRAYYHSSWSPTPCKVELILYSLVQTAPQDLKIIDQGTGFFKLVYFNPDYMILNANEAQPEKLPTIFELY